MNIDPGYVFEPGHYYVGDLCYYLRDDDWDRLLAVTDCKDGIYRLPDGRVFAWFGTTWGDGTYYDQVGRPYMVDSGTIGIVKAESANVRVLGGHVMEFTKPFTVSGFDRGSEREENGRGVLRFGLVKIETNPEYEEEEY